MGSKFFSKIFQFLFVDIGCEGASNDSGIFARSRLKELIDDDELNLPEAPNDEPLPNIPYHFLGDSAFELTTNILTVKNIFLGILIKRLKVPTLSPLCYSSKKIPLHDQKYFSAFPDQQQGRLKKSLQLPFVQSSPCI